MDNLVDWFYGQVVGFLGNFFAEMGNMGVELFELDWVQAIVLFFSQLRPERPHQPDHAFVLHHHDGLCCD